MQPEYMTKQANDDLIVITRKKLQKETGVYDDAAGRVRLPENRLQDF